MFLHLLTFPLSFSYGKGRYMIKLLLSYMYYLLSNFGHMDEGEISIKYHQSVLQ
jgi:hypothetical protein